MNHKLSISSKAFWDVDFDKLIMKLEAITSRNTKKDFFDISELLKTFRIEDLLNFYTEKYS